MSHVTPGYHNLPEKTASVMSADDCAHGDIMRRDSDSFYTFVGRDDDMFVCNGENVFPEEVERHRTHPGAPRRRRAGRGRRARIGPAFVVPSGIRSRSTTSSSTRLRTVPPIPRATCFLRTSCRLPAPTKSTANNWPSQRQAA